VFELVFLCGVERNLLKINKISSTVFGKKKLKTENFFYVLKKLKKEKQKNIFVKFAPKRSAPKWALPKRATTKVVAQKRRAFTLQMSK